MIPSRRTAPWHRSAVVVGLPPGASCTGVRAGCLPGALASDEVALPLVTFPLVDCDTAGPAKPSSDADKLNEAEALMAKAVTADNLRLSG